MKQTSKIEERRDDGLDFSVIRTALTEQAKKIPFLLSYHFASNEFRLCFSVVNNEYDNGLTLW